MALVFCKKIVLAVNRLHLGCNTMGGRVVVYRARVCCGCKLYVCILHDAICMVGMMSAGLAFVFGACRSPVQVACCIAVTHSAAGGFSDEWKRNKALLMCRRVEVSKQGRQEGRHVYPHLPAAARLSWRHSSAFWVLLG